MTLSKSISLLRPQITQALQVGDRKAQEIKGVFASFPGSVLKGEFQEPCSAERMGDLI